MEGSFIGAAAKKLLLGTCLSAVLLSMPSAKAAGLTLITHGFETSGFPGWVSGMTDQVPIYYGHRSPDADTNLAIYRLTLSYSGGNYLFSVVQMSGGSPLTNSSGEIVIELDWSSLSGDVFDSYADTYHVAWAVAQVLMQSNAIPELNGRPLTELPMHLIGHSRGGSLVSQMAYDLGTNGIWVDHLTTLDPYPINNDGNFNFPATIQDAPAKDTYANVLFADNYWQDLGSGYISGDPDGEPVSGAYVRQLFNLSGGYGNDHSNVHLWYHGTVDTNTPASDTEATITGVERTNWYVPYETQGAHAGFLYSRIGGGDRTSADRPLGLPTDPKIRDGYNQLWDLGGGTNANRTLLPSNDGTWPDVIELDITGTLTVTAGSLLAMSLYYQYAGSSNSTLSIYFDRDFNPYNTNSTLVLQSPVANTGMNAVAAYSNLGLPTTNVPPGVYAVYAQISDGRHTRYLYAPQSVQIISAQQPVVGISKVSGSSYAVSVSGTAGQTIVLQISADLQTWTALATNTLSSGAWVYTNNVSPNAPAQFYRALLGQ